MSVLDTFASQRLAATREFAHTMIIVDDEAWRPPPPGAAPRAGLRAPRRGRPAPASDSNQQEMFLIRHALDTEKLVDAALELGLVCSVIRPPKGKSIKAQVSLAAKRADIVCLDWELHEDGGDSATKIITKIARSDEERNGRLRLIAIYTGDTNNNQILEKVFDAFPRAYRERFGLLRDPIRIESNHGLRIVCLFKAHGVQLADARRERQVREADLPGRLQEEFALLTGGLLSNVALATIASIRDATHHVLAKMAAPMDGPYFHHRSILPMVGDAEEYSVDLVLSDLKSEVDKRGVAQRYAGRDSIAARIREIAGSAATLAFRYPVGTAAAVFNVNLDDAIRLVTDGCTIGHGKIQAANKPSLKVFKRDLSSLFTKDIATAHAGMREFAVLTGVRSHPGSHLYMSGKKSPQLGLGSVVRNVNGDYYLCLQASCDSVRIKKRAAFLFIPLNRSDDSPEHVVPVIGKSGKVEWIGLAAPPTAYAESLSVSFDPDSKTETVLAKKAKGARLYFFKASNGERYRWVADLKQRRALRTAQKLGQSMGRLGFDEFEPFRQD
jgi:Response receiver domain